MKQFSEVVPQKVRQMAQAFVDAGGQFAVVGGAVRDFKMGVDPKDFDVVVAGMSQEQVVRVASQFGPVVDGVSPSAPVFVVGVVDFEPVEVAMARSEMKRDAQAGESEVQAFSFEVDGVSFKEDAFRRDFRFNSMRFEFVQGQWVFFDDCDGMQDVADGVMRPCSPSFPESPDRFVRAAVQSAQVAMKVDQQVVVWGRACDPFSVKAEQFWVQGFRKMFRRAVQPSRAWKVFKAMGWDKRAVFSMVFGDWDQQVMDAMDAVAQQQWSSKESKMVAMAGAVRDVVGDDVMKDFFRAVRAPKAVAFQVWQFGKPEQRGFKRDVGQAVMASQQDRKPGRWVSQSVQQAFDDAVARGVVVVDAQAVQFAVDVARRA